MNRNILALIIGGSIIALILSLKFFINEKKEFFNELNHYIEIKKLVKEIKSIKFDNNLNYFKHYKCKIQNQTIECNLSKKEFATFQNIFKRNYDFKSFAIEKKSNYILINLELNQ